MSAPWAGTSWQAKALLGTSLSRSLPLLPSPSTLSHSPPSLHTHAQTRKQTCMHITHPGLRRTAGGSRGCTASSGLDAAHALGAAWWRCMARCTGQPTQGRGARAERATAALSFVGGCLRVPTWDDVHSKTPCCRSLAFVGVACVRLLGLSDANPSTVPSAREVPPQPWCTCSPFMLLACSAERCAAAL